MKNSSIFAGLIFLFPIFCFASAPCYSPGASIPTIEVLGIVYHPPLSCANGTTLTFSVVSATAQGENWKLTLPGLNGAQFDCATTHGSGEYVNSWVLDAAKQQWICGSCQNSKSVVYSTKLCAATGES